MANPFEQGPPIPGTFSLPPIDPSLPASHQPPSPGNTGQGIAPPPGFENVDPQPSDRCAAKELRKACKQSRKEDRNSTKEQRKACKVAFKAEKQLRRSEMRAWREQRREIRHGDHWTRGQHRERCCKKPLHARFVKHVSIEDGSEFSPSASFLKTWRMRNDGTLPWPADTALYYVSQRAGDQMSSPEITPLQLPAPINSGDCIDVSVKLISPSAPGLYAGFWKLCGTHKGKTRKFGQQIWCKIQVLSSSDDEKKKSGGSAAMPLLVERRDDSAYEEQEMPDVSPMQTFEAGVSMATLLTQLKEMGFADTGKNIALIKRYDGDLVSVVDLLSREQSAYKF